MKRMAAFLAIGLVVAACSSSEDEVATTTSAEVSTTAAVAQAPTTTGVEPPSIPPQIEGFDVQDVLVGDRTLLLAIADNPSLRRQGLQHVTDLEDLDGMLFFWRHDGDAFWMKDTPIPLDIVWFNEDGTYKDRTSMVPCVEAPCPTYAPDDFDFRFAIEADPGTLDWIDATTVIVYSD